MTDYGCSKDLPADDRRLAEYKRQRKSRGFDDTETWSFSASTARFMIPRLKRFKEINNGFPPDLTPEKWDSIIQQMVDGFEEELLRYDDGFDRKKVDKGLRLFSKWFQHLWW